MADNPQIPISSLAGEWYAACPSDGPQMRIDSIRLQPARKGAHMYSAVACGVHCFVNSMPKYVKESAHAKRAPPNMKTGTLLKRKEKKRLRQPKGRVHKERFLTSKLARVSPKGPQT
eukprot:816897-Pelagomonas_calceolata.AAC.1